MTSLLALPWTADGIVAPILIGVLAMAVWFDVRERRIPNWITAGGFLIAFGIRAVLGPDALLSGMLGGGLGLGLGILFFLTGAMGAGDGKLLATVGCFLGFETFLLCLPLIGAFGGLLALAVSVRGGTFFATMLRCQELVFFLVTFGRIGDRRTLATPGSVSVPYGVAIATGAVTAFLGWGLA